MKKLIFLTLALLAIAGKATAQNTISCVDITAQGGQEVVLPIQLTNDDDINIVGISFTLTLPEGATFKKKTNGKPVFELVDSRLDPDDFSVTTPDSYSDNSIGVRIYTTSSTAVLQGTEGTFMTFTLDIAESMEAGDYDIRLTENKLSIRNSGNSVTSLPIGGYTSKLTITGTDDGRIVLDETSETAPEAATNVNVRVKRTIKANEWSTICLPFAMTETQIAAAFGEDTQVQLADFAGYMTTEDEDGNIVGITVNFNNMTAIVANRPCIIKVSKAVTEFTVDGVDIAPIDEPKINYGTKTRPKAFIGTYVADFDFYNAAKNIPLFLNGGSLYYATEETKHMKAFRAYFDFNDMLTEVEESYGVKLWVNNDDATGIRSIDNGQWTIDDGIYNLAGQRVGKSYKGIVIENGKKILK